MVISHVWLELAYQCYLYSVFFFAKELELPSTSFAKHLEFQGGLSPRQEQVCLHFVCHSFLWNFKVLCGILCVHGKASRKG